MENSNEICCSRNKQSRPKVISDNWCLNHENEIEGTTDKKVQSSSDTTSSDTTFAAYTISESKSMLEDFLSSGTPTVESPGSNDVSVLNPDTLFPSEHLTEGDNLLSVHDSGRFKSRSTPCSPTHHEHLSRTIGSQQLAADYQIRSFTLTTKGFIGQKNCLVEQNIQYTDLRHGNYRHALHTAPPCHPGDAATCSDVRHISAVRVALLGSAGVGKNTLLRMFAGKSDESDDDGDTSVSILLDGEESTMEFVNMSDRPVDEEIKDTHYDAFVVVYCVEDRSSYEAAINRLLEIREVVGRHVTLILVANKRDLVRTRVISAEEGRAAAKTYESKYIEVSATIDLKIDELLVGVLKQIRLMKHKYKHASKSKHHSTILDKYCHIHNRDGVLAKIFKGANPLSKSCDNLYVL